jgi:hypothetical protein
MLAEGGMRGRMGWEELSWRGDVVDENGEKDEIFPKDIKIGERARGGILDVGEEDVD